MCIRDRDMAVAKVVRLNQQAVNHELRAKAVGPGPLRRMSMRDSMDACSHEGVCSNMLALFSGILVPVPFGKDARLVTRFLCFEHSIGSTPQHVSAPLDNHLLIEGIFCRCPIVFCSKPYGGTRAEHRGFNE